MHPSAVSGLEVVLGIESAVRLRSELEVGGGSCPGCGSPGLSISPFDQRLVASERPVGDAAGVEVGQPPVQPLRPANRPQAQVNSVEVLSGDPGGADLGVHVADLQAAQ